MTAAKPPSQPSGEGSETAENVTYHRAAEAASVAMPESVSEAVARVRACPRHRDPDAPLDGLHSVGLDVGCPYCLAYTKRANSGPALGDHPHTDPGDGRVECQTCGKFVWLVTHSCKGVPATEAAQLRHYKRRWIVPMDVPHPKDCSCAIPCRRCGHQEEQHAGSVYGGTGPARCLVTGCRCKGRYIGDVAARCKQAEASSPVGDDRG